MPWFLIIGGVLVAVYIATRTPPVNVKSNLSKSMTEFTKDEKQEALIKSDKDAKSKKKKLVFGAAPSVSKEDTINGIYDKEIEGLVYKMIYSYKIAKSKGYYDSWYEKAWGIFTADLKGLVDLFSYDPRGLYTAWEKHMDLVSAGQAANEMHCNFSAIQMLLKKRTPYGDYWPVGLDLLNVKTGKKIPFIPHV